MTLEEFYTELAAPSRTYPMGEEMLLLLEMINGKFKQTQLYGLTSHARLVVLNADDSRADWLVSIIGVAGWYYMEYLMPATMRPWENAYVKGEADSLEEAKRYLAIAMTECGGWPDNEELLRLAVG